MTDVYVARGLTGIGQSVDDTSSQLWGDVALPLGVWESNRDFSCPSRSWF